MDKTYTTLERAKDEEKWLESRRTGIGASEAAVAAGASRYATPLELYHQKRGELPPQPATQYMVAGHRFEWVIRELFKQDTGMVVTKDPMPLARSNSFPRILATPDYGILRGGHLKALLECKTTESPDIIRQLGEEGSDEIPTEWICQAQQQAFVFDVQEVYVAVLIGRRTKHYCVERDGELIDALIRSDEAMWERIEDGNPPPIDYSHPKAMQLIKRLHGEVEEGKTVDVPDDIAIAWEQYAELGREESRIKKERKSLQSEVMHWMGDAAIGKLPGGKRELARKTVAASHREYDVPAHVRMTARNCK